jgi:hypothetical protein
MTVTSESFVDTVFPMQRVQSLFVKYIKKTLGLA